MATKKPKAQADSPQQQLAPVTVEPAANDEARAAIDTIKGHLAEFDKTEAGIAHLEKTYAKVVYAVDTPKGMREACEARAEINRPIHATEAARKAAKAPLLTIGRDIDARAKVIDTRLRALVAPIVQQIDAHEQREKDRKAALEKRVREIQATPGQAIGKKAAQLQEIVDALASYNLDEFNEYREVAAAAITQAQVSVGQLLATAKQAEEAQAIIDKNRIEEERKAKLRTRLQNAFTAILDTAALCRTSERIQQLVTRVEGMQVDDTWEDFAATAREERTRVLVELGKMLASKKAAEAEALEIASAPAAHVSNTVITPPAGTLAAAPPPATVPSGDGSSAGRAPDCDSGGHEFEPRPSPQAGSIIGGPVRFEKSDSFGVESFPKAPATAKEQADKHGEIPTRPSHSEMVGVLVHHYNSDTATVIGWLADFDAQAVRDQLAFA